jgi:hypothetical protein
MSSGSLEMLIKTLDLIEQRTEIQEEVIVVEEVNKIDDSVYLSKIEEFLFNLNPTEVGVEKFGPYTVHFEGFTEWCQQDANDRCYLPKDDPRHLDKYEDIYDEVLRDFINREDGKMPIDSGLTGDEEYPTYYAIFKEEDTLTEYSIVESVDAHTIYGIVQGGHREPNDFVEGDIGDRIYWFDDYKQTELPISQINLDEYYVDEDLVEDYIDFIKDSPNTMPPIVYDPIEGSVIDGIHRANAYARLGRETIPAYVGLTKSSSYGEREEVDKEVAEPIEEASPNTLEGSFTPDLVESKTWLCDMLAKGLKGKNAGTIYVLGSWYGNMGIFLQQEDIKFDKIVMVEPNEKWLRQSKKLLDKFNTDGKIVFINQKAEDVVYEKPGVVINTSCNETGPVFLTNIPDNMLCLLQARDNVSDVSINTDSLTEFDELFSLSKVYYTGEKELNDPETEYTRYMKIGRK